MTLETGTRLGHYEIGDAIGAGGMGEVYKARDTRLDRTVAVKVLPTHLSENKQLRERFAREARAISSLNHPHICTLHDIGLDNGIDFLVMEYLEGETLASRLRRGALPLDEALRVARQVTKALDAAHRQGVVHRDLKPGNIMLTKSGVKLLDFGLAKTTTPTDTDLSAAPTAQKPLTETGAILGTFQYMAPEQLDGGEVERTADIFAFGAVLHEMVTGEKAFTGKSQASLIAAILEREPKPVSEVQPASPASLDRLIQSCLRKDPDERWESARDLERELVWVETGPSTQTRGSSRAIPWVVAGVALLGLVVALFINLRPSELREATRVTINLPEGQRLSFGHTRRHVPMALSLDGRRLAYSAESDDAEARLYLRELSSLVSVPIPGTEGGHSPFFSPDGEWLGFLTDSELKKLPVSGGLPTVLAPVQAASGNANWGHDGYIYYSPSIGQGLGLMRIAEGGGTPERISRPMLNPPRQPQLLPDGKTVLVDGNASTGGTDVGLLDLDSMTVRAVNLRNRGGAVYVPGGFLLFGDSDGSIMVVRFDAKENVIGSNSVPVAIGGALVGEFSTLVSVANNGTLAYLSGAQGTTRIVRVDRNGQSTSLLEGLGHAPRVSSDGRRLVFDDGSDIWIYDLSREALTRLTTDGKSTMAAWTPDSASVAFVSTGGSEGSWSVVTMRLDGAGQRDLLAGGEYPFAVESLSPDGRYVALTETTPDGPDIIVVDTTSGTRSDFVATPAAENGAQFSPDGRFIAYVSDEPGRREVYVRPFPDAATRWQISTQGGSEPVWSPHGTELFYRAGSSIMSVPVDLGAAEPFGRPEELFAGTFLPDNSAHPGYAVEPSGESFIMRAETFDDESITQIHLVLNWFDELERLVPAQ